MDGGVYRVVGKEEEEGGGLAGVVIVEMRGERERLRMRRGRWGREKMGRIGWFDQGVFVGIGGLWRGWEDGGKGESV